MQTAVSLRAGIVRKVLEYRIPDKVIEKYADKHGLAEPVARAHERELKRYGMFGPVDELRHAWILFTPRMVRVQPGRGGPLCPSPAHDPRGRGSHLPGQGAERLPALPGRLPRTQLGPYPAAGGGEPPQGG